MTTFAIYSITAVVLFCVGLMGLAVHPNLLRKIVCLNIMAGGAFLFLISLAYNSQGPEMDPVPQAMVLTGIVVAVSATSFALCLTRMIKERTGQCHLEGSDKDKDN